MALFDLPETERRTYWGSGKEPQDFDEFWHRILKEARTFDRTPEVTSVDTPLARSMCSTYTSRDSVDNR